MADDTTAITIDGTEYQIADLSENARNQVMNLRVTDQEIARLQQLAIAQTAHTAYARALSCPSRRTEPGMIDPAAAGEW
ncbi:DUF6447 family protein [Salinicola sp. LHM]|uniref:DUF6447 family protein n=1 Tax=Salinicola sp. LHM TaxID=3065298 RepID=UPI002ACE054B|nr:DUF6447 family protein [Salinicola sp. LHM]WQH34201.1 DUF6447 family protein [Salinicola sp. LHM]